MIVIQIKMTVFQNDRSSKRRLKKSFDLFYSSSDFGLTKMTVILKKKLGRNEHWISDNTRAITVLDKVPSEMWTVIII